MKSMLEIIEIITAQVVNSNLINTKIAASFLLMIGMIAKNLGIY